jgi:hypothetical protein
MLGEVLINKDRAKRGYSKLFYNSEWLRRSCARNTWLFWEGKVTKWKKITTFYEGSVRNEVLTREGV